MMVTVAKNGTSKKTTFKKPKLITATAAPATVNNNKDAAPPEQKKVDKLETMGSKIHAQRKFAQGAAILPGMFSAAKVPKEAKKKREKRTESPTFLPTKRPKTEDFLTFLCFRGTEALSKDLEYFNYPTLPEDEIAKQIVVPPVAETSEVTTNGSTTATPSKSTKPAVASSPILAKSSTPVKERVISSKFVVPNTVKPAPKKIPDVMMVVKQAEQAVAAVSKSRKDASPISKPAGINVNEQDAHFALTALKLKYQEIRMAKSKPVIAVATKNTKKRCIELLTRSKGAAEPENTVSAKKVHVAKKTSLNVLTRQTSNSRPINASPTSNRSKEDRRTSLKKQKIRTPEPEENSEKSSDSESQSSDSSSSSNSESESSSSPEENKVPATRSLRNGKSLNSTPARRSVPTTRVKPVTPAKRSSVPLRVSTRSAHRSSDSPLRELPMWPEKMLKKPEKSKNQRKKPEPKKERVKSNEDTSRSTRKSKESASICLGLISTFSSDEDASANDVERDSDSTGSSSASEEKFLQKQYNASKKRDEENSANEKKSQKPKKTNEPSKSTSKTTVVSKNKSTKAGSKSAETNSSKAPMKRILRSQSRDETPQPSPRRVTTRRVSASQLAVNSETEGAARKTASVYPRRRNSYSTYSSEDTSSSESESETSSSSEENAEDEKQPAEVKSTKKHAAVETAKTPLAARKSAAVTPRKPPKPTKGAPTPKKAARLKSPQIKSEKSDDDKPSKSSKRNHRASSESSAVEESSDYQSENETSHKSSAGEEDDLAEKHSNEQRDSGCQMNGAWTTARVTPVIMKSEGTGNAVGEVATKVEGKKRIVQKASIAIQVDMDADDEAAAEISNRSCGISTSPILPRPETPPTAPIVTENHDPLPPPPPTGITSFMSSVNISNTHIPYVPFSGTPGPGFYPLHLSPPVVSNIQLLARGTQEFALNAPSMMNIPASVPFHGMGAPMMQPSTMCFSSTSISAATTLETHIRSVAANLSIPLVRPPVGGKSPLEFPSYSRYPYMHDPSRVPLTRPVVYDPTKPHASAFRVPGSVPGSLVRPSATASGTFVPLSVVQHHPPNPSVQSHQGSIHSVNAGVRFPMYNNAQAQDGRFGTTSSMAPRPGLSSSATTAPGYSYIHTLPNVSIVPKFDRNSKPVVHAVNQEELERKIKNSILEAKSKANVAEKPGKKKKVHALPKPTSPLTVRKDSSSPATYTKSGKPSKDDKDDQCDSEPSDPFFKLLQKKKPSSTSTSDETKQSHSGTADSISNPADDQRGSTPKSSKYGRRNKTGSNEKSAHDKVSSRPDKQADASKAADKIYAFNDDQEDIEKTSVNLGSSSYSKSPGTSSSRVEDLFEVETETESLSSNSERRNEALERDIPEAPTFYPTEEEFKDPLKYIEKIRPQAESFGLAKIVPPSSFKPECNVEDDMRFTAYNHYIHKMYQRWGPNVHETQAIKEHLRKSDIDLSTIPMIGSMEIDLCSLYQTVQSLGGLNEVIEKQKWNKVCDAMHIPKSANDRVSKLDLVYMKYILPYETLSEAERKRLLSKVEKNWNNRQERLRKQVEAGESDESDREDPLEGVDDCIIKGKTITLRDYFRVARNTKTMLFPNKENPSIDEIEEEYWNTVQNKTRHLCVYSGSIDCNNAQGVGWGFPSPKNHKHPWNLKVLASNPASILRCMGPVMGATVPTLHVGMIFTTYCWYRDPHGLPWVEYLHSGGGKIWYVVPAKDEMKFRDAVKQLMPLQCRNKKIWLASDSAMIPPSLLREKGVSISKVVQNPEEFVVVFPKAYTSAVCTGYLLSESVCFASNDWLLSASEIFSDIKASKEPPVFPIERLLLSILRDQKISFEILRTVLPQSEVMLKDEFTMRKKLVHIGLQIGELSSSSASDKAATKKRKDDEELYQCDICNYILYLSVVTNEKHEFTYCLPHAIDYFQRNKSHVKSSVLRYDRSEGDLIEILKGISNRLKPG